MSYTCPVHQTEQDTYCLPCIEGFKARRDANTMTGEERADELLTMCRIVTMPFTNIHQRVEELVGRPVFTHELGGEERFNLLVEEARTQKHIGLGEILDKIPGDKPIIVLED